MVYIFKYPYISIYIFNLLKYLKKKISFSDFNDFFNMLSNLLYWIMKMFIKNNLDQDRLNQPIIDNKKSLN